ncbi:phage scaffolding protein [Acetobacter oeni]|uniref:Uncharacterized protein n=1 Tax=Acetobacter oeni TaxID=304077 RepID=A0A511XJ52_9PROT|nr:phage scaffolding protein [Acetobacter oeni]MBB3882686.1 hypothetical protein [Acetobacter oeni]NHO18789.1 hypothetical protein [Acetobacter oeni]GBR07004.1 hypothetical protein AA21952_2200 [Acetobacter oeni LMG 21952]GEN62941.1 hypothetical protein AOE01nite_11650 [Acetobacter oeni]
MKLFDNVFFALDDGVAGNGDLNGGSRSVADSVADAFSGQLAQVQADLAEARAKNSAMEAELERARVDAAATVDAKIAEMAEVRRSSAIKAAAITSGLVDMDCLPLLNASNISVDADGNVFGVEDAFKEMKTCKPFLFSSYEKEGKLTGTAKLLAAPKIKSAGPTSVREMTESDYRASLKKIAPSYSRRFN